MKLADHAKQMGVRYEPALRWFRDGKIRDRWVGSHTIIVTERPAKPTAPPSQGVATCARVLSADNQGRLDSQRERLAAYRTA